MASVSFRNIRKSYGHTTVVHGFDLDIEDGEFIVLVGPSGCGKSTCLRMLAGLEEITAGELAIEGKVINEEAPGARDVAMVFQDYALYPHMSVAENLGFSIKNRGHRPDDVTRIVKNASNLLALDELLERKPKDLSGGQRQRVAMGRAIVRKPAVYLFDEPLSNLDAKLRGRMRQEIKKLHKEQKTTTIYVTHDQVEAMTLADRMVVMNAGRVEQIDRPREIYRNPTSKFVAEFIGSPTINMIPATVNQTGQVLVGGEIAVAEIETSADYDGAELWLGVRQEDISVGLVKEPSDTSFSATVQVVEPLGPETLLFCEIADHEISARVSPDANFSEGNVVYLDINFSNCTVFDRETEQRIPVLTDTVRRARRIQGRGVLHQ